MAESTRSDPGDPQLTVDAMPGTATVQADGQHQDESGSATDARRLTRPGHSRIQDPGQPEQQDPESRSRWPVAGLLPARGH
jgi:hypothetical protein